jgi:hypothetical protein
MRRACVWGLFQTAGVVVSFWLGLVGLRDASQSRLVALKLSPTPRHGERQQLRR